MTQAVPPLLTWWYTVPLLNFDCTGHGTPPVVPGGRVQLAPLRDDERDEILKVSIDPRWNLLVNARLLSQARYKLTVSFKGPSIAIRQDVDSAIYGQWQQQNEAMRPVIESIQDEIVDILAALRLIKRGLVGADMRILQAEPSYQGIYSPMPDYPLPRTIWNQNPAVYSLTQDDVSAAGNLASSLQTLRQQGHYGAIGTGLRRFNLAYGRDLPDDRLIDLAVVLESTLLAELREELNYRLAIRGAGLLAATRDPAETHALLLAMYKARSEIVHNGEALAGMRPLRVKDGARTFHPQELPDRCEDVVRDVLKAYLPRILADEALKRGQSQKPVKVWERVNSTLDGELVNSLRP